MDKSSGQGGRSGQSSSAYKVNVNRTKTRKWVEAKTVNYDGDDWGASDDDEPESPDEPPMPQPRGPPPLSNSRLPSDTRIPALRRPTFPIPSANQPPQETISTPAHPPIDSQPPAPSFPISSIAETRPPASKSPSNDSRRSPDQKIQNSPPAPEPRKLSFEQGPEDTRADQDDSPKLPNVARMSTFGSDMFSGTSGGLKKQSPENGVLADKPVSPPTPQMDVVPEVPSSVVAPNPQRPQLPGGWVTETRSIDSGKVSNPSSMNSTPNITYNARPPPLVVPSSPQAPEGPPNAPHLPPPPSSTVELPSLYGSTGSGDSSPIKKSDALSDEIMRSLTPGGIPTKTPSPPANIGPQEGAGKSDVEDFLNNRGEYWGESSKQPAAPTHPPVAAGPASFDRPSREQSPQVDSKQLESGKGQTSPDHLLRNRFSWEKVEQPAPGPPPAPVDVPGAKTTPPSLDSAPIPVESKETISNPPDLSISPTIIMVPGSGSPDILAPSGPSDFNNGRGSPGSDHHNTTNAPFPIPTAQSLEKEVLPPSPTTNDAHSVTFEVPREKDVMSLKEIMTIPPGDRLSKFQTTRLDIAMTDSGLNGWMAALMTVRPEHANASCSLSGAPSLQTATTHGSTGQGPMGSSQESGAGAKLARARLAGFGEHAQAAAESAFGHGGNQIGHKSKEFMQSAGKMGKGLFSKGRSKLRGTGDKKVH
ncbi:unnamed protein product [Clonostachys rosea]|uniref:Uncharacterized protein n=1 Tax=Bionectria ochroleuca TaxID=29856 RepID=A0ABY6TW37_BIOOC|nr:unnamed protein product [Clonostachys rosea]